MWEGVRGGGGGLGGERSNELSVETKTPPSALDNC